MDSEGFTFDLRTQRFIVNRWDTELGRKVQEEVCDGLKNSVQVEAILDEYVLHHKSNIEPYGYPYYPVDAMEKSEFWVLTNTDLRGISFYHEDLSKSPSFEKMRLSYSIFYNCNLSEAELDMTEFSCARIEKSNLFKTIFAASGGFSTSFIDCDMREACLLKSGFIDPSFVGCDLRGAYFEDAVLKNIAVNHLSKFDINLATHWRTRRMAARQRPDILRAIRLGYQAAELWEDADRFLFAERTEKRKHVLWYSAKEKQGRMEIFAWAWDLLAASISGYGTKPFRVVGWAVLISLCYAVFYVLAGAPESNDSVFLSVLGSLYFSFTTFATLGYGDMTYSREHPFLRLLSTSEAWLGAIFIALLVVVLARKIIR